MNKKWVVLSTVAAVVVVFIAIHLLWMRFLEPSLTLYPATVLSVIVGWLIITRG